ncbi:MAG: adenylate/guanylate cyclase domain-containing protein [Smithellaceae bacterium]|nr:adenylate/guanylate cyclase domain-containing protein [Smithellaceae bacterium]
MKIMEDEKVRRPIGVKILGIMLAIVLLMSLVTGISNHNLKNLNNELFILSDFYIPLDQMVSDVRQSYLTQILSFERFLASNPGRGMELVRQEGEQFVKGIGICNNENLRSFRKKTREKFTAGEQRYIVAYEMQRYCTNQKVDESGKLVEKALTSPVVTQNPELIQRFTKIQSQLADIPQLCNTLHRNVLRYLKEREEGSRQSLTLFKEQLDLSRRELAKETAIVSRLLHQYTNDAAVKSNKLERQAFWFNWGMTFAGALLALILAYVLTRNLVEPLKKLLYGARAIEEGNLNIQIQVKSSDEIAQLAKSFNYMVLGLREKETIKEKFGQYIDPKVVSTLLDPTREQGEKHTMTVFFSDIQGFSEMSEHLSPDNVVKLINHYISMMSEPIRRSHGVIDKYIGDAIMAFWGPPFTDGSEHAELACTAALEQQALMKQFEKDLPEIIGLRKTLFNFNIHVRMGICTGDVIVGSIGAEAAKNYTVIGDTVNLASRLEAANKFYGTNLMISGETHEIVCERMETRELDLIRVAGKTEPVRIFELLGHKGEISEAMMGVREHFEQGLAHYRNQEWIKARECFESCLKQNPEDSPSKVFISRLEVLQSQSPGSGWDGIWTFSEK